MEEKIGLGEWRTKIERHSGARREYAGEEVPRVEDSLDHARAAFAAFVPSFRSGAVCCCLRHRRKSASLQRTILSAELTTLSGVLAMNAAYFSTATAIGS